MSLLRAADRGLRRGLAGHEPCRAFPGVAWHILAAVSNERRTVVKTYGRGSFLAFLSPLLAYFMARGGMNGWEQTAQRDVAKDALSMQAKGYRVVSADEYTLPVLGIGWFKVTYELAP